MRRVQWSLAALIAIGAMSPLCAADTLSEAFKNGTIKGEIKIWYWNKTDEAAPALHNESILNTALELGYKSADFYGFSLGSTFQANATPFANDGAKEMFVNEEYASGAVLSEAYLGYGQGTSELKVGRQYINTPSISGSYNRIFKESFEGVTFKNGDIPDTKVFVGYIQKFQGRTSHISGDDAGDAPLFVKKIILAGAGPLSYAFDGVYSVGLTNRSIPNLTLGAQYTLLRDVASFPASGAVMDDISLYYAEANYLLPMEGFKLGFDVNYKGSRTGKDLDFKNLEGDMWGLRFSVLDFYGFGASLAYTTVSSDDDVILGLGNGAGSYTVLPIRGPLVYSGYAGMDSYSLKLFYDFAQLRIKGLRVEAQYLEASQDAPSVTTRSTTAGTRSDYKGYSGTINYAIPALEGLSAQVIYTAFEREMFPVSGASTTIDTDELWVNFSYKF
ncbi:OprD family outer membrane porin [Wolinella succinogenes]|uniref:OprD family outer membrane porin n=1 Tax=Wolinella succinogenes TaxID=844 RepID=UPI00240994DC|nr:OprD family outer membrane porin [Wolinella succinogenes]